MSIPESQLETWSHRGAAVGSRDTYLAIKKALEAPDAKYASKPFEVFLQGSYGNDTNIWAESDVDVAIRLDAIYYYDISVLSPERTALFGLTFQPGNYPYADYKSHVVSALVKAFGPADVKPDKKAIKIKASGHRRSADVVVTTDFHRYNSSLFGPQVEHGICFFDAAGERITNYPKQHLTSCNLKDISTSFRFKPMVRVFKNMRSKLIADKVIPPGSAPSYFIENLLYNVPNDKFSGNYGDTVRAAVTWISQANRTTFKCANGQCELVKDSSATCWSCGDCDGFIGGVIEMWNDWH